MKKTITLAGLLSLCFMTATGQIQYTPFTTDSVTTTGSTMTGVDVDNDGYTDFDFLVNGMGASLFGVSISTFHDIAVDNLATFPNTCFASYIFSGIQINSQYKWADKQRNVRLDDQSKKNFFGQGESFIGFRFEDGGDYYYGWIMLELTSNLTLRIKGFAIESSPNTPIVIGDTGSNIISLEEQETPVFKVYPTAVSDHLNVEFNTPLKTVEVISLTGKVVYSSEVSKASGKHLVNMAALPNGIYLVTLTDAVGSRNVFKVVKQGK